MKITIDVKLPEKSSVLVKTGDKVSREDALATAEIHSAPLILNLAKMLKVSPKKINKYITASSSGEIKKDEVIARKKGILSTVTVKSPSDGMIEDIDLEGGLLVYKENKHKEKKIYPPVSGVIKSIKSKHIELECEGEEYSGEKSRGERIVGRLQLLKGEQIGVLDVTQEMSKAVILVEEITSAALSKIDALGGAGVIATNIPDDVNMDYILVSKSTFDKMIGYSGHDVVVDPSLRRIFILS